MSDQTAMDRWVATFATRDAMARSYRHLLDEKGPNWGAWPILNVAIMDRWSASGLAYIKTKAWSA